MLQSPKSDCWQQAWKDETVSMNEQFLLCYSNVNDDTKRPEYLLAVRGRKKDDLENFGIVVLRLHRRPQEAFIVNHAG